MSFLESSQFPPLVSLGIASVPGGTGGVGFAGGPDWLTTIVVAGSGYEYRNQSWAQARRKYDASHAARLPAQYQPLQAFFAIAQGRTNGFRLKDWTDYQDSDAGGAGVFTMITATTFQMNKQYTSGSSTFNRLIKKPVVGTVVVTGGVSPTLDTTTGIVTVASGTPTSWTGQFDVPCRFDTDNMKVEIIDISGGQLVIGWSAIPIIEIRV